MQRIRLGIIGCGTIGTEIAKACLARLGHAIELSYLCDLDTVKAESLKRATGGNAALADIDQLIVGSDLVVEAASAKIAGAVAEKCVAKKRDLVLMSVGGLLDRPDLLGKASERGVRIYIPSGAVSGIDGLKSASIGKVRSVTLTTRKPFKGLEGAPYLKEKNIDLALVKDETVIFEGSALEAIKGFPQNVNVSAVLSLAGIGAENTRVRLITGPSYTKNIHEVEIEGECGRITTRTENVPSTANPKTSCLAILSAIATLEGITNSVRIGT